MQRQRGTAERHVPSALMCPMQTRNMQRARFFLNQRDENMHHASQSRRRWHAEKFYLGLHELRVALVDVHLLELVLSVVRVQQAAGLQHLDLVL